MPYINESTYNPVPPTIIGIFPLLIIFSIAFWYFTWQILYIFSAAILPYSAMKTTGYVVCHIPLVADRVSGHFPVAVFFL